jgi:hypothetical protein
VAFSVWLGAAASSGGIVAAEMDGTEDFLVKIMAYLLSKIVI